MSCGTSGSQCCDSVSLLDSSDQLIGNPYCCNNSPGTITTSDNVLTLRFHTQDSPEEEDGDHDSGGAALLGGGYLADWAERMSPGKYHPSSFKYLKKGNISSLCRISLTSIY